MNLKIKALVIMVFLSISNLFGQEMEFTLPEFPTPPVMEIPAVTPSSDETMDEGLKATAEVDGQMQKQD